MADNFLNALAGAGGGVDSGVVGPAPQSLLPTGVTPTVPTTSSSYIAPAATPGTYTGQIASLSNGKLRFPWDLEKQPFWTSFSFYQYKMPSLTQMDVYYADNGTIRLPLPNSMVDNLDVQYSPESLGLVAGAAINALQGGHQFETAGILAGAGLASRAGVDVGGALNNNVVGAATQTMGAALNPFLTVMFKQPAFKNHRLEWKLTPSNEQESQQLNQIINMFRANMLPDKNGALGGALLTYPNIVQVQISVNNGTYFTYAFKPAVITSFSVNFTPSGQPSFFGSSASPAPTEAILTLSLTEIEYWLSSDFGLNGSTVDLGTIGSKIAQALSGGGL